MTTLPACPKCSSAHTYEDGALMVCPECAHEWSPGGGAAALPDEDAPRVVKDAGGNVLADGDTVTVVKDHGEISLRMLKNVNRVSSNLRFEECRRAIRANKLYKNRSSVNRLRKT